MLRKIFTNKQLSLFFQVALFLNVASLMIDLITFHYFLHHDYIDYCIQILNELSLFMICIIVISQILLILFTKHQLFISRYKLLSLAIASCICMFFFWLLAIDNDIQEDFIIFLGKASQSDHGYSVIITLITIFTILLVDFYLTLQVPEPINKKTLPSIIHSTIRMVIKEHFLIFISIFGTVHIKKIDQFALSLFHYTESSIIADFTFLEILIPIAWFVTLIYYLYHRFYKHDVPPKIHTTK